MNKKERDDVLFTLSGMLTSRRITYLEMDGMPKITTYSVPEDKLKGFVFPGMTAEDMEEVFN